MEAQLNANTTSVASGVSESERLEALYTQHFSPAPGALRSACITGDFKIFSAIDYSVKVSYSNGSQKLKFSE